LVLAYRGVPWLYNSAGILVLADVARTWPYAFLILWPSLRAIPREALESAEIDGLSPWKQVTQVALPLTRGTTVFTLVGCFLLALGELPASGLVAPPGITTLPVLVWGALHIGVESRLAAIALLLLLGFLSGGAILLCVWLRLRRISTTRSDAT
jgi:iron(III) transport system permease protein